MDDTKNGDIIVIRCKECGKVLCRIYKNRKALPPMTDNEIKQLSENFKGYSPQSIEIKCHHRTDKGFCKAINTLTI